MKSTRTPAKAQHAGLPYGAIAHTKRQHQSSAFSLQRVLRRMGSAMSLLNPLRTPAAATTPQLTNSVRSPTSISGDRATAAAATSNLLGAVTDTAALQPGDVVRDCPFFTPASEVAYFATHASLCADVFGFVPGEVLELKRDGGAALFGHLVYIVGARGGRLYICGYGEQSARALHIPVSSPTSKHANSCTRKLSSQDVRAAVLAAYGGCLLHHPTRDLTPEEAAQKAELRGRLLMTTSAEADAVWKEMQADQQRELAARVAQLQTSVAELQARAEREALRVFTAEQRAFLQRAPDLYVAALPPVEEATLTAVTTSFTGAGTAEQKEEERRTRTRGGQDVEVSATENTPVAPTAADPTVEESVYAAIARGDPDARAVVLLAPHIVVTTGTVGWTGEGGVQLHPSQAGTQSCEGSLSASVVI